MTDEMMLTLNSPITEEQWDIITDVDFEHTPSVKFHTKHGKEVEFVKVIRCKNCAYHEQTQPGMVYCPSMVGGWVDENWFCADGEEK